MTKRDDIMRQIYSRRGLAAKIAKHLAIKPQAVHQWHRVPAEHAWEIAQLLGLPPQEIRPDIFRG